MSIDTLRDTYLAALDRVRQAPGPSASAALGAATKAYADALLGQEDRSLAGQLRRTMAEGAVEALRARARKYGETPTGHALAEQANEPDLPEQLADALAEIAGLLAELVEQRVQYGRTLTR